MEKLTRYGTAVVIAHAVMVAFHALAHQMLPVPLSWSQGLFIGMVIVLAPIFAVVLLWTRFSRTGTVILFGSMTGALAFGLYNHFIRIGSDHVSQIPDTEWGILFQITAVLLAATEGVGVWGLNHKQPTEANL
ncbi:MAG: hypothetical protein AAFW75_28160 [Cyanobacteria bacterium J06636_16]